MRTHRVAVNSAPAFVPLEGEQHHVFNEAAFRYFFEVERARAAQANRPLLLLLVRVPRGRQDGAAKPDVAAKVFAALTSCVRDVDVVGWYREGSLAGAVLTLTGPMSSNARHALSVRVSRTVLNSLSADELTPVSAHAVIVGPTPRL
jgi:hypothetical protein